MKRRDPRPLAIAISVGIVAFLLALGALAHLSFGAAPRSGGTWTQARIGDAKEEGAAMKPIRSEAQIQLDHALANMAMHYVGVSHQALAAAKEHVLYTDSLAELERAWPCEEDKVRIAADLILQAAGHAKSSVEQLERAFFRTTFFRTTGAGLT